MSGFAETVDEDELVTAAGLGDRMALGELYTRYARMVHAILLSRVPFGDAEDLVQEVFLSTLEKVGGLRTAGAFRGWLVTIARNKAIDHHRAARRRVDLAEAKALADRSATPDAFLVLGAIRRLPEAYRETLVLRLVEGMTGPEIAQQTGLTPDSVRVNLSRGMSMLRELLKGGKNE